MQHRVRLVALELAEISRLGAGTSATVNGLGCVSSHRSMAGGLMANGTPANGYAEYSAEQ